MEPGFVERVLHPDDRERVLAEVTAARVQARSFRSEYRLLARDGAVVSVFDEMVTVADELGRPMFLQGYLLDMTDRRRAEVALRHSEELYRLVVENSLDGISLIRADGTIQYASPSNETLLGYGPGELAGRRLADVIHPDDLANVDSQISSAFEDGGEGGSTTARLLHRDGHTIEIEGTASVVTMGGERLVLTVTRDVSDRAQLEAQLRQAQKLEAVGRLAGGVAHDFNNLLTAIGGYADYVLRGLNVNDPLRQDALEIKRAADRAAALTQQLLAFSRQQVLQARILDLGEVVGGVDGLLRRLIGEDVELEVAVAPGLTPVKADRGQLEQVIVNLALNARDAMPAGGRLTISCDEVDLLRRHGNAEAGPHIRLVVSDTGHGFDEATRERLFEPFFTTKGPGEGTGLGLATVHGIVEQSGGTIDVWSEPGRGTTFTIYLPCAVDRPELVEIEGGAGDDRERGSETVLLVEDEDAVRALARRILTAEGYTVVEARDGIDALELCSLHEGRIDIVVTDVVMPGLSGRELVDRVERLRPGIRSLYISGYTDEAIVHHGVLDEEVAFLAKPFTAAALGAKVRETLDARRSAPSARVLVVEDEEAVRDLVSTALTEAGYEVLAAREPREAIEIVERDGDRIDLLLTDIFMPRMSGRSLSHHLSALRPDMRLLYMSGKPDDVLLDVGVVASGAHFLSKPFTLEELQSRVRAVLASPLRKTA
jgi:PAS domain S-box-containing protein